MVDCVDTILWVGDLYEFIDDAGSYWLQCTPVDIDEPVIVNLSLGS